MNWIKISDRLPDIEEATEERAITIDVLTRIKIRKSHLQGLGGYKYYAGYFVLKKSTPNRFFIYVDDRELEMRIFPNEWAYIEDSE